MPDWRDVCGDCTAVVLPPHRTVCKYDAVQRMQMMANGSGGARGEHVVRPAAAWHTMSVA
jgi:hypothetical protein